MPLQFIESEKGKKKLINDGYFFYKDKQNEEKIYWKCDKYHKIKCKERVTTQGDEIVKEIKEHNHVCDAAEGEAQKVTENVSKRATSTIQAPHALISNALVGCSEAAAVKRPKPQSMKRTVRGIRFENNCLPPLPQCRSDLFFTDEYTKSCRGENFLLFDSGPTEKRIVIFATQRCTNILANSDRWYGDGTFKTVPLLFYQLYTFHGFKEDVAIALIYALLPDKSETTYSILLEKIKEHTAFSVLSSLTIDFEPAMIKACRIEFPSSCLKGCFFHFCRCIFRVIQTNGLKRRYEMDADFALNVRYLPALAFVPVDMVVASFELLCNNDVFSPELQNVVDYFEDTWIGCSDRRNRRRPPRYELMMWNVYEHVLNSVPKTNYALEGWHRAFETQVAGHHPNIWKFLEILKKKSKT
ncbi:uncharacterized protein [Palaemon carinicauda]|uniref:uncharacterized protein n=1 Tax=Palaemon carinicauda TaxID=392227 RepID=UPI0035B609B2